MEWVNEDSVHIEESGHLKELYVPGHMIQFSYRFWIKLGGDNHKTAELVG